VAITRLYFDILFSDALILREFNKRRFFIMAMYKVSPDVTPRNQPLSTCCWLTCLEMLFTWKKKDISSILGTMDQSPNLFPYYMKDAGISPGEVKETAKYLGLKCGTGEIEAKVLHDCLKQHGPMWIAGDWVQGADPSVKKDNSHVIVVTACDPDDGRIKYINPYANNDLSESPGTVSWLTKRSTKWKNADASVMYW
jgi:hypothetical protein